MATKAKKAVRKTDSKDMPTGMLNCIGASVHPCEFSINHVTSYDDTWAERINSML
jgi:hypothetical protein